MVVGGGSTTNDDNCGFEARHGVACTLADPPMECVGEGHSRRAAEQVAAERILATLDPN